MSSTPSVNAPQEPTESAGEASGPAAAGGPPKRKQHRILMPRDAFRTVFLEMIFNPAGPDGRAEDEQATVIAKATGFFYQDGDETFIVTARHNLTGRHWETNDFLSTVRLVEPTHLRVTLRKAPPADGGWSTTAGSTEMHIALAQFGVCLIDEAWRPLWLEHPEMRAEMDVAALPFPDPGEMQIVPWELSDIGEDDQSRLWITQDLSIAGYPFGLVSGPGLPLWIRGSIASEPTLFYSHKGKPLPALLVDARTRKGQSGSPVMLTRLPGTPILSGAGEGSRLVGFAQGIHSRLIGVYTGRISDESDLGFVWRMEEARKVCQGVRPEYPFRPLPDADRHDWPA